MPITQHRIQEGDRFGRRVAAGAAPPLRSASGRLRLRLSALCDCGRVEYVLPQNLRSGRQCAECQKAEMVKRNVAGTGLRRGYDPAADVHHCSPRMTS